MIKTHVIGIDMGGTNTVLGIVDRHGCIKARAHLETTKYGADVAPYIAEIAGHIRDMISQTQLEGQIRGIGVGSPNGNYYDGCINFAANLPWQENLPLAELLHEATHLPVAVTNDAKAAAIGEMTYGAALGMKHFIEITLGTGVGSGIVVDGRPVYGYDGLAGELGHVIVEPGGRLCGCGRRGCLETYCSARGVVMTAKELLAADTTFSLLRNIPAEELQSRHIGEAADRGDLIACKVLECVGKRLGKSLADFVTFSSPEAIILFGGVTKAGEKLLRPTREAMQANLLKVYKMPKLMLSQLPEGDAAVLGAAALGWAS